MLLSERPNKTYIVVVEQYNSKLGIDETSTFALNRDSGKVSTGNSADSHRRLVRIHQS